MLNDILKSAAEKGASDIHLHVKSPPMLRVSGELYPMEDCEPLSSDQLKEMAYQIFRPEHQEKFEAGFEIDTSYSVSDVGRFRVNVFRQRGVVGLVLRKVNAVIPSFEELNLPPAIEYLTRWRDGLILVTGMTGSGKSTTLAAMIDHINSTRRCHIVTLEDPIEYLHHDKNSIVSQREIGQDSPDFKSALRSSLRQDPDIILVGEMRDAETVQAAVTAAETGHLVLSTLHTTNAPQTIERILEFFQGDMRHVITQQLAAHLRGVISQRLCARLDGQGMIPAVEVMLFNPLVKKMILENKLGNLKSVIHSGANEGMQTFDQHLVNLYNSELISFEEGQAKCSNPDAFHMYCQGFFSDIVQGILE